MSRYTRLFNELAAQREAALIPFLMLGDPDVETSMTHIDRVIDAGADAIELGIPFSDPVADGPVLFAAATRALNAGITPAHCLKMIGDVRARHPDLPIGLLVYANLVHARGVDTFFRRVADAGADSVLVPDMPLREAAPLQVAGERHSIDTVFILPTDADQALLTRIAGASRGYTYVLGRAGVTGSERAVEMPHQGTFAALAALNAAPPVVGFGVSTPAHVSSACSAGARGVIVGSALAERIINGEDYEAFIRRLKNATCTALA